MNNHLKVVLMLWMVHQKVEKQEKRKVAISEQNRHLLMIVKEKLLAVDPVLDHDAYHFHRFSINLRKVCI